MLMEEELGGCELGTPAASPSPSLPDELLFEILLGLPVKDLHQCNCVSKGWRTLIGSPGFIQAYKDRHLGLGLLIIVSHEKLFSRLNYLYSPIGFRPQPVLRLQVPIPEPKYIFKEIAEVVNGLVCLFHGNHLFVCNLFTGKVRPLPHPAYYPLRKFFFGFDVVNGVYKLLAVNPYSIEILTLGIGSDCCWRMVYDNFETGGKRTLVPLRNFCVDGVLYWMVASLTSGGKARCYLCSFDLNKEKLGYIKVPQGFTWEWLLSHLFAKFQGRLALSIPTYRGGGYRLSLHVLEDDEGNVWTKHSIPLPEGLDMGEGKRTIPVGNLPDGRILLLNPELGEESSTPIYVYDHQTCKFDRLCIGKLPFTGWVRYRGATEYRIYCVEENLIASDVLFN